MPIVLISFENLPHNVDQPASQCIEPNITRLCAAYVPYNYIEVPLESSK